MNLSYVKIKNFRSIEESKIDFSPTCRALIGINESGKTNILHALSLLSDEREPGVNDVREPREAEAPIDEAHVWFVFSLSDADRLEVLSLIEPSIVGGMNEPIVGDDTLTEFTNKTFKESLYRVNLISENKGGAYWSSNSKPVCTGWYIPKKNTPSTIVVGTGKASVPLNSFKLVHEGALSKETLEHCSKLSFEVLLGIIGGEVSRWTAENIPSCVLWSYSDSQLLPASIPVSDFCDDPSDYEPLEEMFALAGYSDPEKSISEAAGRKNGTRNLLRRVAKAATTHLKSVWREYKDINISLEPNGDNIEISIQDSFNLYDFERRSDGFKRFISFLFLVSAKTKNGSLNNTLYLHDEPDSGLHPSGCRHLLSELVKVSKGNYVVFSTHSIFMIDCSKIDRHYIVRKAKETTTVEVADSSNFRDEEVLYNALEFSTFEVIHQKNLLFEGWKDKQLFKCAISGRKKESRNFKKMTASIGFCHAQGVKDVGKVSSMLELANREWLVISDGDGPAIQHQKNYEWQGKWFRYDQLGDNENIVTSEDFFTSARFSSVFSAVCKRNDMGPLGKLSFEECGKLKQAEKILGKKGIDQRTRKLVIDEVKDDLIDGVQISHIREEYFKVMKDVVNRLTSES